MVPMFWMGRRGRFTAVFTGGAIFIWVVLAVLITGAMAAADQPTHIELNLTESFYQALRAEGTKTYSTSKSEEYLRQIAVSSRFAVESNLKIIEGQKRIIELLEAIRKKKE